MRLRPDVVLVRADATGSNLPATWLGARYQSADGRRHPASRTASPSAGIVCAVRAVRHRAVVAQSSALALLHRGRRKQREVAAQHGCGLSDQFVAAAGTACRQRTCRRPDRSVPPSAHAPCRAITSAVPAYRSPNGSASDSGKALLQERRRTQLLPERRFSTYGLRGAVRWRMSGH